MTVPVAEVIAERRYGGVPTVRVLCPLCGRTHLHPQPTDPPTPVAAHCGGGLYTLATERKPQP
ncbi:hypothetical protein [Mycobacterium seoulense]|uniref:Uncharacterized protein n=1 Tax=Mycobacterium seoulense TaxID=386911 RepID=A0A7I7NZ02_9MYCO|nr:hypothetical protein [Mycobacterium seoulense]MCV7436073.1 hypothetical protein [Mycobacterium seoulense]BBY01042.1 hypothetical protein MSEO_15410 [Mycobacterium seoulense]